MSEFAILGGDLRSAALVEKLMALGHSVKTFGLPENVYSSHAILPVGNLKDALSNSEYIVLPLPCSQDGTTINMPLSGERVTLRELSELLSPNQTVFAGKIGKLFFAMMETRSILFFDYSEREEFSVLNAIPTAEGAIEIAMRELPVVLHASPCLVIGYGRIGKVLAGMLQGLGASVTVSARQPDHIAWIQAYGYKAIETKNIKKCADQYQVIFNTVPHLVLNREVLSRLQKDCLIIDLASKPGGVDFEVAKKLDLKAIQALSLPGKAAPRTAGIIIADTILNILKELEA